jgi:hypothetical protein
MAGNECQAAGMFHLSYTLGEHGWAAAVIGDGNTTIDLDVSYLSDALGDLARAARGILRGMTEASFSLMQEPGEHRFVLSREHGEICVRVYRFPDTFSRKRHGALVLDTTCSVKKFANICINCLRAVLDEHGEAGYRERWQRADLPMQEYRDLLELRRQLHAPPAE